MCGMVGGLWDGRWVRGEVVVGGCGWLWVVERTVLLSHPFPYDPCLNHFKNACLLTKWVLPWHRLINVLHGQPLF